MDNAPIDFRHRRHASLHRFYKALRRALAQRRAQRARQNDLLSCVVGQAMSLLATPKLQPMLNSSQEHIRAAEFVIIAACDVSLVVQFLQREQCSARAQPRLAAAVNALQALRQEFNVANAAASNRSEERRVGKGWRCGWL